MRPQFVFDERTCRVCGCTEDDACVDPKIGACWWVELDLCSHCARKDDTRRGALVLAAIAVISALACVGLYLWGAHIG